MPTLSWLDRDKSLSVASRVPVHILQADEQFSYGEEDSGNLLIQGDNLHALKALLPYYRGAVKCVFIDPPYNTKSAFKHYPDSLEHSKWLEMMFPRLELLRELLAEDGSIWVTIDDHEAHYLKVVMDEIFGRGNFVANCVWRSSDNSNNDAKTFSVDHNHILIFSKNEGWLSNKLDALEKRSHFKNPDNDPKGAWFDGNPLNSPKPRENLMYDLVAPNGNIIPCPKNGWRWEKETMQEKIISGEIRYNEKMTSIRRRTYLANMKGLPPSSLWSELIDTGHNRQAKGEQKTLFVDMGIDVFSTPKPERLIKRIIEIATNENDLVLDSFLGSGTTAAVAHKMNRSYIGIELGEHAKTHCAVRLKKVVDGDQGGISKAVGWAGGGGFSFYTLGAELFTAAGTIHREVKFRELAAYLWFSQTRTPYQGQGETPLLGIHNDTAYYLLYNGILKDKRANGGNIITRPILQKLPKHNGNKVIFANGSRLGEKSLKIENIIFHSIPWEVQTGLQKRGNWVQ